ncbi:MAG: glycolate oxidase subunit GlcF, partial [Candidatus Competibacteraceae bacterium]|nr:glycolate oxidase subunit GlcF [Candidatus Competibacteraceae bacterium]
RLHLDRCLTCRNCETTCPSGVQYHKLLDVGRKTVERLTARPLGERLYRRALRAVVLRPAAFAATVRAGRAARALLPAALADKLPPQAAPARERPPVRHARRVLLPEGCVQPELGPNINAAAARVLDRLGISAIPTPLAGCCGAMEFHLNAQAAGLDRARRNIDLWSPLLEAGAEAIVQTASGCGAFIKDYGELLADDPRYAAKARRVSEQTRDLVEIVRAEPLDALKPRAGRRIAFHCPCTLQHAQKLGGAVDEVLRRLGCELAPIPDAHLCCGSAGTYALTQPELAAALRDRKLDALESGQPALILTANIGCQLHLEGAGRTPVRHWIEWVEEGAFPTETRS